MRNPFREHSLKNRLYLFLKNHPDTHYSKGELMDMVADKTDYVQDNAGRRLRELAKLGLIKKEEIKGKKGAKHAWYWYSPPPQGQVIEVNGRAVYRPPEQLVLK